MFKSAPRTAQGGFTLIELVVVIVILGILAAFAVPRFARLDDQARLSSVRSLEGSLNSAAAMTHGMWMAAGNNPATVSMEGAGAITMTAAGYPTATNAGIRATLSPSSLAAGPGRFTTFVTAANVMEFRMNGAAVPTACLVRYTAPVAANTIPTFQVVAALDDC